MNVISLISLVRIFNHFDYNSISSRSLIILRPMNCTDYTVYEWLRQHLFLVLLIPIWLLSGALEYSNRCNMIGNQSFLFVSAGWSMKCLRFHPTDLVKLVRLLRLLPVLHRPVDFPRLPFTACEVASSLNEVRNRSLHMPASLEIVSLSCIQNSFVPLQDYNHHETRLLDSLRLGPNMYLS